MTESKVSFLKHGFLDLPITRSRGQNVPETFAHSKTVICFLDFFLLAMDIKHKLLYK